jgi:hypothetical protein
MSSSECDCDDITRMKRNILFASTKLLYLKFTPHIHTHLIIKKKATIKATTLIP